MMRYVLPVLILLLAFGLRVTALADQAVWWDEAWSVWTSQHIFDEVTEITARDIHPPVYQWVLFGWIRLAGISEFAVRMLSVYAGVLAVAVAMAIARRLGQSRRAMLSAGLLLALSVFHVNWSQETRMYALAALLASLSVYAYLRVDERLSGWWALLVLGGLGASLSHYLAGLILVILNVHWLLTWRKRSREFHKKWLVAMLLTGIGWGAWMLYAIGFIRTDSGAAFFDPVFTFHLTATLFAVGQSTFLHDYLLPTLGVTVVFFAGLGLAWRYRRDSVLLVFLAAILPPLTVTLLSVPFNPFYAPAPEERYFVIFAPVVYAGLGLAITSLGRRFQWIGLLVFAAIILLFGVMLRADLDERHYQDDYRSMMMALDWLAGPDDRVFFMSDSRYPLVYYNLDRVTGGDYDFRITGIPSQSDDIDALMTRMIGETPSFWLVEIEAHLDEPQGARRAWIDSRYTEVYRMPVGYNGISFFTRADDVPDLPEAIMPPVVDSVRPGDEVRVGVPAGETAELLFGDQVVATKTPDTWQLVSFTMFPAYPPGDYGVKIGDEQYKIQLTHSQTTPDSPPNPLDVQLGPMKLLGYALNSTQFRPGDTLELTLYWEAVERPEYDYTVFAQLLGPFNPATNGPVWGQLDSYPAETPTTQWWPGLAAYDRREILIPPEMPAGTHVLAVGLYRLDTGERLTTADNADAIIIPDIVVSP